MDETGIKTIAYAVGPRRLRMRLRKDGLPKGLVDVASGELISNPHQITRVPKSRTSPAHYIVTLWIYEAEIERSEEHGESKSNGSGHRA